MSTRFRGRENVDWKVVKRVYWHIIALFRTGNEARKACRGLIRFLLYIVQVIRYYVILNIDLD